MERVGEEFYVCINLDFKLVKGDWNGLGMYVNFFNMDLRNYHNIYLE